MTADELQAVIGRRLSDEALSALHASIAAAITPQNEGDFLILPPIAWLDEAEPQHATEAHLLLGRRCLFAAVPEPMVFLEARRAVRVLLA